MWLSSHRALYGCGVSSEREIGTSRILKVNVEMPLEIFPNHKLHGSPITFLFLRYSVNNFYERKTR